jgi:hypothetical protein
MAVAVTLALTALVAFEVCRIPVQVSDSVGNLLQVQHQPLGDVFFSQFSNGAYVRPLLWAEIKLAYEAAHEHETVVFKAIHVAQLLLLAGLMLRLLSVRSRADLAAAALAVLVLFGLHTFDGLVREAFPINSFLTIVLCVFAVIALADAAPAWWRDAAAAVIVVVALLTIESGLLVATAAVAARLAGLRGISWKAAGAIAVTVAVYLVLRIGVLHIGGPALTERAAGFGFRVLEPHELAARFGTNPVPFYAANIVASLATVLFAEPRGGVWYATQGLAAGSPWPAWLTISVAASVIVTGLVLLAVPGAVARWRSGTAGRHERLLLVALTVLVANAVVSFAYTKDVIMSAGGACFALAVYAATAMALSSRVRQPSRAVLVAVGLALGLWSVRAAALPVRLEMQAARVQAEWRDIDGWLERQHIETDSPEARALVNRLRRSALRARPRPIEWSGWRTALDLN